MKTERNHTTPVDSPMISIGPRVRKSPYFGATMRWAVRRKEPQLGK